ncbi:MAG: hypothetical protein H6Q05_1039 [Acidobacteria bacterium]|nr:hypothetical protein [Acidobacteriota bacterium]
MRHTEAVVLVALALLCSRVPWTCFADTLTGEVRGTVLDIEGGVPLAGATVTLTSVDRGWKKQLQADSSGTYTFLQLEPGSYSVSVEMEGYYPSERTDVLIRLNMPKVLIPPFELRRKVSTPTQQITLRGEQTKTAIVDLSNPGATPAILAVLTAPGFTSLVTLFDAALRFNFGSTLVQSLPLAGGRTFDQLALYAPGVFRVPFSTGQGPSVGIGVGSGGQFSVNGMRPRSNNFTVDGSDNNDEDIGLRRQGFVALVPQSVESIEEFQVVTAGFLAEAGRNSGSMVNAVSQSGRKDTHGNIYGLFGDDGLDARNFFDYEFVDRVNAGGLSGGSFDGKESSRLSYGATIGGPIRADKLFYFLSFEQQRNHGTALGHFVVPTTGERGLRTSQGFVPIEKLGEFFGDYAIDYSDVAGAGVYSLYPLPNNPSGPFGVHDYSQATGWKQNSSNFSAKSDWRLSSAHSFAGRYSLTDDRSRIPFTGDAVNSAVGTGTRTQNISLFLNSRWSRLASALRGSYGRTALSFPWQEGSPLLFGSAPSDQLPPDLNQSIATSYGQYGPFGATGPVGQLLIEPYSPIGVDAYNFPQGRVDNTYQVSEFLTRSGARHTFKAGFDIRHSQLNSFSDRNSRPLLLFGNGIVSSGCASNPFCLFATPDGLLHGTDLAALGVAAGLLQTISTGAVPDTTIGLRFTQYDVFAQDLWKLRSNLTLSFGLRYELQTVPTEANGRIEDTFNLTPDMFGHLTPSGSPQDQAIIKAGNAAFDAALQAWNQFLDGRQKIYEPDRDNFAPRFGVAWDPQGQGRMAIRAGFTVSYDANLGAVTSQSRNVFPTFAPLNLDPSFYVTSGQIVNSPRFFVFTPTQTPLIRPGTLNTYNLPADAFATGLGTLFVQSPPFPGGSLSSNGLAFTLPQKEFKTASAQQWSLTFEKQLGDYYVLSAGYVGTHGLHLTRFITPNAGLVSTPVLLSPGPNGAVLTVVSLPPTIPSTGRSRPQPSLGAYTVFANSAASDFHSLQLSVESRLRRGLQYRASYVWSHAIDEVSDPFDSRAFFSLPQDSLNLDLERASANFDARHRLTWYFSWALPGASASAFLRDWYLAAIGEFQSGQPFTANTSLDRNRDGNLTDRLDSVAGVSADPGEVRAISIDSDVSLLSLVAPQGSDGKVARNSFQTDGIANVDVAFWRTLAFGESKRLDLRVEVFNIFNHTQFGVPDRILESPGFGSTFDTRLPPRLIRLTVRFSF